MITNVPAIRNKSTAVLRWTISSVVLAAWTLAYFALVNRVVYGGVGGGEYAAQVVAAYAFLVYVWNGNGTKTNRFKSSAALAGTVLGMNCFAWALNFSHVLSRYPWSLGRFYNIIAFVVVHSLLTTLGAAIAAWIAPIPSADVK